MKLTPRDIEFLNDLNVVKYLNSKRISKLFKSYRSAMARLKELENGGYIRKSDFMPNGEYVFSLTKRGCNYLGVEYFGVTKTDKLMHILACSDWYFYIKNKSPLTYINEVQYYFTHLGRKYTFRTDILMQLERFYLVEIDLSNRRFEEKVVTWEAFYESGVFVKYFEKYPPIVIVSTNVDKVRDIIDRRKKVDLNYIYKDYNEIREWEYKYKIS